MSAVLITGASGLVGSASARHFAALGYTVVGVDNDMRRVFFGDDASTAWMTAQLRRELGAAYEHHDIDVRDQDAVEALVRRFGPSLRAVIHCAAQPSHDWAARDPHTDFTVNALGTLNMLQAVRDHAPGAAFVFTSTNKVYGDTPNRLPLVELETRWEVDPAHPFAARGIDETMSIDRTLHSVFGASKVAADVMVQEYGRYFDLQTACFRGGTLTGPAHSATELHGFLGYVMRCAMSGTPYTVFGYGGKQVRDAIHSDDLVRAFDRFVAAPRAAEVYNMGGGRASNCSVLEALAMAEEICGRPMAWSYSDAARVGDHIWWIGDNGRFEEHYPGWRVTRDVRSILEEMHAVNGGRWADGGPRGR